MTPLKRVLDKRGFKARSVAQEISVDPSNFRKWVLAALDKRGKIIKPTPEVARKIARYLGNDVTEHQLLYPEDYMQSEPAEVG